MLESSPVVTKARVVGRECVMQAPQFIVSSAGVGVQFCLKDEVLQSGVGVRSANRVDDGVRGILKLGAVTVDQWPQQFLGDHRVSGLPGMEGKKKAPTVGWFSQPLSGVEGIDDLVDEVQGFIAVAGLIEKVNGSPDTSLETDDRTSGRSRSYCLPDERVIGAAPICLR